ncbi:MAG TPA: TonB family protein, partial [Verrucomicrobiota bacterium]|nr:TonB family protein [Verrucomicrobiota bacterium]
VSLAGPRWRLDSAPPGVELLAAEVPAVEAGPLPAVMLRVAFDAAGFPGTPPVLLASSGDPAADAAALAAARRLRFKIPAAAGGRPGDPAGVAEVALDWGAGGTAP